MKERKEKQFAKTYEIYADMVYRLCLFKTSDSDIAEDLVQEAFMRFWDQIAQGKKIRNKKAFLFQITRNLIIDHYRKRKDDSLDKLQEQGFEPSENGQERIVSKAEKNIAIAIINKLDEKYRDVVYLRLVEEMSFKDIAQTLDITSNNATVSFHRGKQKLEQFIKSKHE